MYYTKSHESKQTPPQPSSDGARSLDRVAPVGAGSVGDRSVGGVKKPEPKPRGRPPTLTPEEKTQPRTIRLTDGRWEKLRRLGSQWLARAIDKAKEPKE